MELKHSRFAAVINKLKRERAKLDQLVSALEAQELALSGERAPMLKRPGRKSMGAAERRQVGERMSRYWATVRAAKCDGPRER